MAMIPTRRKVVTIDFSGGGMFGWIATHVHKKTVAKQLQIILEVDLVSCDELQEGASRRLRGEMGEAWTHCKD